MMPTIRIDDDVFQGLKSMAEPFTDTPNTVIRRLLKEYRERGGKGSGPAAAGAAVGEAVGASNRDTTRAALTPQPVYEEFLLFVLSNQFAGRAGKREATAAVLEEMNSRGLIGAPERERVSTGETKAENTVAWGRNALKERGLLSRDSPRGMWELTAEGLDEAKRVELPKGS
jgi:hypothetical protein